MVIAIQLARLVIKVYIPNALKYGQNTNKIIRLLLHVLCVELNLIIPLKSYLEIYKDGNNVSQLIKDHSVKDVDKKISKD